MTDSDTSPPPEGPDRAASPSIDTEWTSPIDVQSSMQRAFDLMAERGVELDAAQRSLLITHGKTILQADDPEMVAVILAQLFSKLNDQLLVGGAKQRFVHRYGTREWVFADPDEAKALKEEARRHGPPPLNKSLWVAPVLALFQMVFLAGSLIAINAWLALAGWVGATIVLRSIAKPYKDKAWGHFLPNVAHVIPFGALLRDQAYVLAAVNAGLLLSVVALGLWIQRRLEKRREMHEQSER